MSLEMHENDIRFCVDVIRRLARQSRATRAQVGCVIWHVPTRRIISLGYNGTAAGTDNRMEMNNKTLSTVIHAEENALRKLGLWERWWLLRESVLFVTHAPCLKCSELIVNTRIPKIYYLENYGNMVESLQLLKSRKRTILRILT